MLSARSILVISLRSERVAKVDAVPPAPARPVRPADTMNEVFGSSWQIEVDNMVNAFDVNASCRNIGRHQNAMMTLLE